MLKGLHNRIFDRRKSNSSRDGSDQGEGNVSDLESSDHSGESSSCSSSDDEIDVDVEGPVLVTVDDGKGGIKHIKVDKPPDTQSEIAFSTSTSTSASLPTTPGSPPSYKGGAAAAAAAPTSFGLGNMMRKEFKGRNPFHIDPEGEKLRKRIVSKKGVVHIGKSHMGKRQQTKYLTDFFNTMLDIKWRYVLLLFCMSFFLSWLAFAIVWYIILFYRGDFMEEHLPDKQSENNWMPCVYAMFNFASCFLFSIETQHTIGYGSRQTTEKCPEAIFVMSFQSVVGVMIQACMVGTVFAKLTRPKKRAETLMFSKNAVVCQRDGYLCLCFRVGNMRSSHLVETHTRAILVSKKVTDEGEVIPFNQTELKVGTDLEGEEDTIFFIWPTTIVHRIDDESPFYGMTARDFLKKRFELIVVLEGIVEPTGMSIQARSSYLPNEILWGYRFVNVLNYRRKEGVYKIDYGSFNTVYRVDKTPNCSGKCLVDHPNIDHQVEHHGSGHHHSSRKSTIVDSGPNKSVLLHRRHSDVKETLRSRGQNLIINNNNSHSAPRISSDHSRIPRSKSDIVVEIDRRRKDEIDEKNPFLDPSSSEDGDNCNGGGASTRLSARPPSHHNHSQTFFMPPKNVPASEGDHFTNTTPIVML